MPSGQEVLHLEHLKHANTWKPNHTQQKPQAEAKCITHLVPHLDDCTLMQEHRISMDQEGNSESNWSLHGLTLWKKGRQERVAILGDYTAIGLRRTILIIHQLRSEDPFDFQRFWWCCCCCLNTHQLVSLLCFTHREWHHHHLIVQTETKESSLASLFSHHHYPFHLQILPSLGKTITGRIIWKSRRNIWLLSTLFGNLF